MRPFLNPTPFLCSTEDRRIPPSRPDIPKPPRAAAVKGGRQAGAPVRALPFTAASTAASSLILGERFERCASEQRWTSWRS
jgi:hypothetical protein